MPKFRVFVAELWTQPVIVEAANEEEARTLALQGEGEVDEDHFECRGAIAEAPYWPWKVQPEEDRDEDAG